MKKLFNISLFVLLSINLFSCREKIDAANYGLLIDQYGSDKGKGVELVAGATWYNPWNYDVVQIPGYVQHVEYKDFPINASDGSEFILSPILNYRVQQGHVEQMYKKYRKDLDQLEVGVIKTIVKESYRIVLNSYTTDSLMGSRARFEKQVFDTLRNKLENEGFDVEQLTSGLKPPASITQAINSKNQAVQDAMTIDNQVKTTEAEARKKVAKANGDAQSQVIAAEAASKSLLIQAKAESEANRLKQMTLTPILIQKAFVDKWNGELPTYGQVPTIFKGIQ